MPDGDITEVCKDLYERVNALEVKCAEISTDLCWIKKVLILITLIGLGSIGIQIPHYIP